VPLNQNRYSLLIFKRYRYRIEPEYDQPEFRRLLERIAHDQFEEKHSLKEDTTASVWRTRYNSRDLVVKRYNTQGIWHAIRRSFRKSRAENCRKMTDRFKDAGIDTAPNIAVIQEWAGPFKLRSWFICGYIEGKMLIAYFKKKDECNSALTELTQLKSAVADLFEKLRIHHLSHGDLKASNILLSRGTLCLIDLDAACAHKYKVLFQRAHKKDRLRFMKNWQQRPEIRLVFEPLVNQPLPGDS
jgi:tRNA A-37 threonylcarbamoyl transferase component Bud32